jgi:hypothetical protein
VRLQGGVDLTSEHFRSGELQRFVATHWEMIGGLAVLEKRKLDTLTMGQIEDTTREVIRSYPAAQRVDGGQLGRGVEKLGVYKPVLDRENQGIPLWDAECLLGRS